MGVRQPRGIRFVTTVPAHRQGLFPSARCALGPQLGMRKTTPYTIYEVAGLAGYLFVRNMHLLAYGMGSQI